MQTKGPLEGRRILVVEDEAAISLMLEDLLTQAGAVVIGPAEDAASALRLIEAESIDCALLDYRLVSSTSLPVADLLRARGVPFLFASGYDTRSIDPRYASVPRVDKVFDEHELIETILTILKLR
jgi:DNA-binding response OmpR family regulator